MNPWVGLLPLLFHGTAMVFVAKLFRVPGAGPLWHLLVCSMLLANAAIYGFGRLEGVWGDIFDGRIVSVYRFASATGGAFTLMVASIGLWLNLIYLPTRKPIPSAQVILMWDGSILTINAEAEALLGWTTDEVKGSLLDKLLLPPKHSDDLWPENQLFDTMAIHKDRHQIPVFVHISTHLGTHGTTFLAVISPRRILAL